MKVKKGNVGHDEAQTENIKPDGSSIADLYDLYEQETINRRKGSGVSAAEIRQFVEDVMNLTGKDKVVLAAIVRALKEVKGVKIENGAVRSAVSKAFKLEKVDGTVYILK